MEQLESRSLLAIVNDTFPPMGGVAFLQTGSSIGDAGGRTIEYKPNLGDEMFYFGPSSACVSMSSAVSCSDTFPEAEFSAGTSLLGAGIARWVDPSVFIDKIASTAFVRYTLTATDLDGNPLPLTDTVGSTPAGLTGDIGSVLKVEAPAFKINHFMEAS